jgi:CMP-N-acetylneuraminic acid synthetase
VALHAIRACEQADDTRYDLVVLAEPTSPLRTEADIEATVRALLDAGAKSALTVSPLDAKSHPDKAFELAGGRVRYHTDAGDRITARQQLTPLFARNGLCYCFRRAVLVSEGRLITDDTVAVVVDRPVVNIDEPIDLLWAEFLLGRSFPANQSQWSAS